MTKKMSAFPAETLIANIVNFIGQKAGPANVLITPANAFAGLQPLDTDLTTIAGLTATTDSFMQAKASAWAARTVAQVRADLGLGTVNFRAHNNGTDITGLVSGNISPLVLGTEVFDNGAAFASGIWTPPAGLVIMSFNVIMLGTNLSATVQDAYILKNGSGAWQSSSLSAAGAQPPDFTVFALDIANGTDTYQPAVRGQTSSSTYGVSGTAIRTQFQGARFGQ